MFILLNGKQLIFFLFHSILSKEKFLPSDCFTLWRYVQLVGCLQIENLVERAKSLSFSSPVLVTFLFVY